MYIDRLKQKVKRVPRKEQTKSYENSEGEFVEEWKSEKSSSRRWYLLANGKDLTAGRLGDKHSSRRTRL